MISRVNTCHRAPFVRPVASENLITVLEEPVESQPLVVLVDENASGLWGRLRTSQRA
jgi:hypothetical protein